MTGSDYVWNGGSADGDAAANWTLTAGPGNPGGLPGNGDTVLITGGVVRYDSTVLPAGIIFVSGGTIALHNPSDDAANSGLAAGSTIIATGDSEIDEYGAATNAGIIDATSGTLTARVLANGTSASLVVNSGTIDASGGILDFASGPSAALANSGTVIAAGGMIDVTASLASANGIWEIGNAASGTVGTLVVDTAAPELNVDISGDGIIASDPSDAGLYPGLNVLIVSKPVGTLNVSNGLNTIGDGSNTIAPLGSLSPGSIVLAVTDSRGQPVITPVAIPVCFAAGTRIATDAGETAIEVLSAGDLVRTWGGALQPIKWIGRRTVDCTRHPEPKKVWPIRIRAGAFAPDVPRRDLLVSPQHAIFAEGVLIPAKYLVNGRTVTQELCAEITYLHIELAHHDILLAEGLPTESYLDTGDRAAFDNGGPALTLFPDFSRWVWDARAFAELKVVGPEVERVKAALSRRADLASAGAAAPAPPLAAARRRRYTRRP